jgi:hypothetical protein
MVILQVFARFALVWSAMGKRGEIFWGWRGVLEAFGTGKHGGFCRCDAPLSTELRWHAYFPRKTHDFD